MANQTVLEELVVRLVGDVNQYIQSMQQVQQTSKQTTTAIQTNLSPLKTFYTDMDIHGKKLNATLEMLANDVRDVGEAHAEGAHHASVGFSNLQHIHHMLMMTGLGGGMVREGMMMYMVWNRLGHTVTAAAKSLMTFRGLAATAGAALSMLSSPIFLGGGAVAGGVAVLGAAFHRLKEEADQVKESAADAMKEVAQGAKTANEAVAGISMPTMMSDVLSQMAKVQAAESGIAKPGMWDSLSNAWDTLIIKAKPLADWLGRALTGDQTGANAAKLEMLMRLLVQQQSNARMLARAMAKRQDFQALQTSMMSDKAVEAMEKQANASKKNIMLVRMTEEAQKTFGPAAELAAQKNITLAQAISLVNAKAGKDVFSPTLIAAREEAMRKEAFAAEKEAQAELNKAAALLMSENESRKYLAIQKEMRERGVSEAEATTNLAEAHRTLDEAFQLSQRNKMILELRDLRDEVLKSAVGMTEGAREAEVFAAAQKRAKEGHISVGEALKKYNEQLNVQRDLLRQRDAVKVYQETQTPQEKYRDRLRDLNDLVKHGAIGQDLYARAVARAQKEILGAGAAMQKVDSILAGSADAIDFIRDALSKTHGLAAGEVNISGPTPPRPEIKLTDTNDYLQKQTDVLKEIRDAVKRPAGSGVNITAAALGTLGS